VKDGDAATAGRYAAHAVTYLRWHRHPEEAP
jgi:hypothetical protein